MTDDRSRRSGCLAPAFILIAIGVVFLLINFGVVDRKIWSVIFSFWPMILIFLGLNLTIGRSENGRLVVQLIFITTVVAIVLIGLAEGNTAVSDWFLKHLGWSPEALVK